MKALFYNKKMTNQIIQHEGLSYKLDQKNKTAELFQNDSVEKDILIPTYIEHEGIQYFVTSISEETFQKSKNIIITNVDYVLQNIYSYEKTTGIEIDNVYFLDNYSYFLIILD